MTLMRAARLRRLADGGVGQRGDGGKRQPRDGGDECGVTHAVSSWRRAGRRRPDARISLWWRQIYAMAAGATTVHHVERGVARERRGAAPRQAGCATRSSVASATCTRAWLVERAQRLEERVRLPNPSARGPCSRGAAGDLGPGAQRLAELVAGARALEQKSRRLEVAGGQRAGADALAEQAMRDALEMAIADLGRSPATAPPGRGRARPRQLEPASTSQRPHSVRG